MKKLILFVVLMFLTTAFSQSNKDIIEIKYGSQFGMCKGYCYSEIILSQKKEKRISKSLRDTISNPTKIEVKKLNKKKWKELIQFINLSEFYSLESTIGCPDCNDGGESWLEILTTKKSYRANYEYDYTPIPIQKFANLIETYD